MYYIELPCGIEQLNKNSKGEYCFIYGGKELTLRQILQDTNDHYFNDPAISLRLSVTKECPNQDKRFVEYNPDDDDSRTWCTIVNGDEKNKWLEASFTHQQSFIQQSFFSDELLDQRKRTLFSRREDRYHKGPNSY